MAEVQIIDKVEISGTQDYKRNDFMQMINDGENNKFDLVLVKSISRFC